MDRDVPKSGVVLDIGGDGSQSSGAGLPKSAMPPFTESGFLGAVHDLALAGCFDSPQSNRMFAGYAAEAAIRQESTAQKIEALEKQCSECEDRFHKRDKEASLLEAELKTLKALAATSKMLLTLAALVGGLAIKQLNSEASLAYTLFGVAAILALFGYLPNAAKVIKGILKQ